MATTEAEPEAEAGDVAEPTETPELTPAEMRAAWTTAAREILVETAAKYHSVITQKDLATEVMARSGVHTKRQRHYWLNEVLTQVAVECAAQDEPLLSSLCVNAQGSVGVGYAAGVTAARGALDGDPDDHAAHERLECHRHFGADLPANGGVRALTERLSATRSRERKVAAAEKMPDLCPKCHTAVPSTGVCDYCD
jgi:hypothetical protein